MPAGNVIIILVRGKKNVHKSYGRENILFGFNHTSQILRELPIESPSNSFIDVPTQLLDSVYSTGEREGFSF